MKMPRRTVRRVALIPLCVLLGLSACTPQLSDQNEARLERYAEALLDFSDRLAGEGQAEPTQKAAAVLDITMKMCWELDDHGAEANLRSVVEQQIGTDLAADDNFVNAMFGASTSWIGAICPEHVS
jgi:hypothetical protein